MTVKTVVVLISDTHCGSTIALSTKKFSIHTARPDELQTVDANKAQQWIYDCWADFWEYVKQLAGVRGKTRKARIVTIHCGDIVDGKHHNSNQVMDEIPDQLRLAEILLNPVANLSDGGLYITYGTEAHNGGSGGHEAAIAQNIGAKSDWEYALDIDGILHDAGHHGRSGQRDWTSAAASIAAEVMMDYAKAGQKLPNYVWRGHSHVVDDSGMKIEGTRAICLPSWQLRTAYGYKVAKNKKRADIGGVILDGDRLDFAKLRYHAAIAEKGVIHV